MNYFQKTLFLTPQSRGLHLVTKEITNQIPEIKKFSKGIAHLFLCHTSASLTINENASHHVRTDMEAHFDKMVPESSSYQHSEEGSDDMPAHIKASIFGNSLIVPITSSRLNLGTWQGIYLCEHRNRGGARRLVVTLLGEYQRSMDAANLSFL